jgi:hypothetical protein
MMRRLTIPEISSLASRPNVRKVAVENFLLTVSANRGLEEALLNLSGDAQSYGWNHSTIEAIMAGIELSVRGNPTPLDELPEYQDSRKLPVVRVCDGCPDPLDRPRACIMRDPVTKEYLNVWYCVECREMLLYHPVDLEIVLIPDDDLTFGWRAVK